MPGQRKSSMELRERATRMALEACADFGRRRVRRSKVQTTSVKNAENGLLWARWSAFWAQRRLAGCVVRTQTRYCEWEPAISHANPLVGVWAALPRLGTAGPRAD